MSRHQSLPSQKQALERLFGKVEVVQVSGPEQGGEVQAAGRWYRFDRFRRVKALRLEFEELELGLLKKLNASPE